MPTTNNLDEATKAKLAGFDHMLKALISAGEKDVASQLFARIFGANPHDIARYDYIVNGVKWSVWDSPIWKITDNENHDYHCFFSKVDGYMLRFGKTPSEDPTFCDLSPEILDLEIITGKCVPIGGHTCKFCYKRNTSNAGKEMTLDTFKSIISKFPKNLSQIAFGITSLHGNPDFPAIVKSCKDEFGVIPNVTTSGADLDDDMRELITSYMGACAVSCYEANPQICYDAIKSIYDYAKTKKNRDMHVNMHLLLSRGTFEFVKKTLADIRDKKVPGLKSVVFLRIKPTGNAEKLDASISDDMYREVISFCLDNKISFGFDSCGAKTVERILSEMGHSDLATYCESCESSSFSSYISVDGMYTSCSFVERRPDVIKPINVLDYESFIDVWHLPEVEHVRKCTHECKASCPWYNLD